MLSAETNLPPIDPAPHERVPLCVDGDCTLIKSDLLWEGILHYARHHPLGALTLPLRALSGRAAFKIWLAERASLDFERIPLREPLVRWLQEEASSGRSIVLATGAPLRYANALAKRLGFVQRIFATEGRSNLNAGLKANALVAAYGERGFDYVGNGRADLPAWSHARKAIVVGAHGTFRDSLARALSRGGSNCPEIASAPDDPSEPTLRWARWYRALRLHQWLKNLLLGAPLLLAHRLDDLAALTSLAIAFLCFGLVSSSVYIMNDLLDLEADRQHPSKRGRPFAAGELPLMHGIVVGPLLLACGFAIALAMLPAAFAFVMALYFVATCSYSLWLKQVAVLDVALLGALYVARVLAGGAVAQVTISFWFLGFSLFLFFSLALAKRYTELAELASDGPQVVPRRGYRRSDLPLLQTLGVASGLIAVLVLALYINSEESLVLYSHPRVLWALIPIFLIWISKLWLLAQRQQLHQDPVVYALTDRGSLALGLGSALALAFAT